MHELSLDNSPRFLKTPNSSFLKQNTIKERWTVRYFTVIVLKTLHNNYIKKKEEEKWLSFLTSNTALNYFSTLHAFPKLRSDCYC